MYEIFEKLCKERGITPYRFCKDTGINSSTISTWKNKGSECSPKTAKAVCEYFDISMDFLMNGENTSAKSGLQLNQKDERDIAKRLENTLNALEDSQESLMFSGEPLDDETRELLKASLENSLKIAKINAKQKFTPKKYRTLNE